MLTNTYPLVFGALLAGAIALREVVGRGRLWRAAFKSAFVVWGAVVVSLALFPLPVFSESIRLMREFIEGPPVINLIPLATIVGGLSGAQGPQQALYVLGNLIAFVPLGVLAPLLSVRVRSLPRVVAIGLIASLAIECSQFALSALYGFAWKSFDIDDVLLNTIGTTLGYAAFALFLRRYLVPLVDSNP